MTGHIRRRGEHSWELKFDNGRDPATGKRITRYASVKGTRKDAERRLVELLKARDDGAYVEPSRLTVAEHVRARVAQWEAAGDIGAKTAERYKELVENQIMPHLGAKLLQKLKPTDLEAWHSTLKVKGRKDGKGGVSAKTITHAHQVLKKALGDGAKNDLIVRNVAVSQQPPRDEGREVVILTDGEVKALLPTLEGRAMHVPVVTALFTGLRRGELLALRWANVDLDAKVIRVREALEETGSAIRVKPPKTRKGLRDVTLPDLVVDTLRKHRQRQLEQRLALGFGKMPDDALVFPRPDGRLQSPKAWAAMAATPPSKPMPISIGEIIMVAPSPPAASSAAPSRPTMMLSTNTVATCDRKAMAIGSARPRLAPASSNQVARPCGRAVAPAVTTRRLPL
jgi:integrase